MFLTRGRERQLSCGMSQLIIVQIDRSNNSQAFQVKPKSSSSLSSPSFFKLELFQTQACQAQAFSSSSFSISSLMLEIELEKLGLGASLDTQLFIDYRFPFVRGRA